MRNSSCFKAGRKLRGLISYPSTDIRHMFIILMINPSNIILINYINHYLLNYIGVFLILFLLRNIIIQHIKISHLQFLSDLHLTAWTQLAEVKDCWMLSLAWQTWTTVPGERIIIVVEQHGR